MNKQKNKLVLKKETLRDLTAQNARDVKGGKKLPKTMKNCKPKVTMSCNGCMDTVWECATVECW